MKNAIFPQLLGEDVALNVQFLLHKCAVFAPLVPLIGYRAVLGLSGYVINNAAFVLAAFYLYR